VDRREWTRRKSKLRVKSVTALVPGSFIFRQDFLYLSSLYASVVSRQVASAHSFEAVVEQWSFHKTGTMRMLASQAEIGVWVQAPGGVSAGVRGYYHRKFFCDCICKILQSISAFFAGNGLQSRP